MCACWGESAHKPRLATGRTLGPLVGRLTSRRAPQYLDTVGAQAGSGVDFLAYGEIAFWGFSVKSFSCQRKVSLAHYLTPINADLKFRRDSTAPSLAGHRRDSHMAEPILPEGHSSGG